MIRKLEFTDQYPSEKKLHRSSSDAQWKAIAHCQNYLISIFSFLDRPEILNVELCCQRFQELLVHRWQVIHTTEYPLAWRDCNGVDTHSYKHRCILSILLRTLIRSHIEPHSYHFNPSLMKQELPKQPPLHLFLGKFPNFRESYECLLGVKKLEDRKLEQNDPSGDRLFRLFLTVKRSYQTQNDQDQIQWNKRSIDLAESAIADKVPSIGLLIAQSTILPQKLREEITLKSAKNGEIDALILQFREIKEAKLLEIQEPKMVPICAQKLATMAIDEGDLPLKIKLLHAAVKLYDKYAALPTKAISPFKNAAQILYLFSDSVPEVQDKICCLTKALQYYQKIYQVIDSPSIMIATADVLLKSSFLYAPTTQNKKELLEKACKYYHQALIEGRFHHTHHYHSAGRAFLEFSHLIEDQELRKELLENSCRLYEQSLCKWSYESLSSEELYSAGNAFVTLSQLTIRQLRREELLLMAHKYYQQAVIVSKKPIPVEQLLSAIKVCRTLSTLAEDDGKMQYWYTSACKYYQESFEHYRHNIAAESFQPAKELLLTNDITKL